MTYVSTALSRKLAEQALEAVKEQFSDAIEGGCGEPKLIEEWDGLHWAVCWDEGPYEWALYCPNGGIGGAPFPVKVVDWPKSIFAEPYFASVLMLYPAS